MGLCLDKSFCLDVHDVGDLVFEFYLVPQFFHVHFPLIEVFMVKFKEIVESHEFIVVGIIELLQLVGR